MQEAWKPVNIDGYSDKYKVSTLGRVYSNYSKHILTPHKNEVTGYLMLALYSGEHRKGVSVHRLVALTFIPNPNNYPSVNHKDEDRTNNNVANLEWCTAKYNTNYGNARAKMSQTHLENDTAKKVPIVVYKDNEFFNEYNSLREASRDLGFNRGTISSRLQAPEIYTNAIGDYTFEYKDKDRQVDSESYKVDPETHGINSPSRTRTKEEMQERVSKIYPNLIIQDDYTKTHNRCHIYCTKHKLMFETTVNSIITQGTTCPECSKENHREKTSHDREYYQNKLDEHKLNTIVIGGDFTIGSEPCTMLCSHCNTSFTSTPTQLLNRYTGNGCKHCNKSHTMTIRNMKRYGHSEEEIKQALSEKGLNW